MIREAQVYFNETIEETEFETLQKHNMDGGLIEETIKNPCESLDYRAWCAKVWAKHFLNHSQKASFSMLYRTEEITGGFIVGLFENGSEEAVELLEKTLYYHFNYRLGALAENALQLLEERTTQHG